MPPGQAPLPQALCTSQNGETMQSRLEARQAHLRLRDHKRPQAVIADGTRHCEHSHHAHAIPKQNLSASSLHTGLQAGRKQ